MIRGPAPHAYKCRFETFSTLPFHSVYAPYFLLPAHSAECFLPLCLAFPVASESCAPHMGAVALLYTADLLQGCQIVQQFNQHAAMQHSIKQHSSDSKPSPNQALLRPPPRRLAPCLRRCPSCPSTPCPRRVAWLAAFSPAEWSARDEAWVWPAAAAQAPS